MSFKNETAVELVPTLFLSPLFLSPVFLPLFPYLPYNDAASMDYIIDIMIFVKERCGKDTKFLLTTFCW